MSDPEWRRCEQCNLYTSTHTLEMVDGQWICKNAYACEGRVRDRKKERT